MTSSARTDPTQLHDQLQASLGETSTIERELTGGGMSRVFVVEEKRLGRRIVVKVLAPEQAADVSIARFEREIAMAASLQHPHIVPLLAAGETDGLPYYTMPFVEGESLRERLARGGALPVADVARLVREIATALAYAHEKGIVHRDIKPANVLLSGGVALVTDFGVAKALLASATAGHAGLTATGLAVGTPAYMAPEQVTADPNVDHRADLYSLGMLAYEMLTGQPPFAGRSLQAVLGAHVTESPEPLEKLRPAVPAAFAAMIMRCLEKRPADRPQRAGEIVQALDAMTISATTNMSGGARPRRVFRRTLGFAAAGIVAVATVGAWLVFGRGATRAVTPSSRLLVAPFENLTGDPQYDQLGRIAADRLALGASQNGSMDVVPSSTVLMATRDTTGGMAERLQRLAAATHAGLLVSGTIVVRGDSLTLQTQVTDVRTGKVVVTLDPVAGLTSNSLAVIDAVGDRLLGGLGIRDLTILPKGYRAPKNAAYQEFARGFERFSRYGDNVGSRPFFERAIAIDSTYTLAYQLLARQYLNAGEFARADSMLRRIERLPQGLSAVERLQLDYASAELNGNLAGLLRAQQQLLARDSSALSLSLLGEAANYLLRPTLAAPALERSLDTYLLMGGPAAASQVAMLAEAYHQAGEYDRSANVLLAKRTVFRDGGVLSGLLLRARAGERASATVLALVDTLLRATSDSSGSTLNRVTTGAMELRAHGDSATAARVLTMARAWIAAHPSAAPSPGHRLAEGVIFFASAMPDSAKPRFTAVARDTTRLDAAGYLGLSEVARGDRGRARAIADSLGTLQRQWMFGANTFWRAAIVGALGEHELAVQLLQQALSEGRSMETWHYVAALGSLHGQPSFERLVRPQR